MNTGFILRAYIGELYKTPLTVFDLNSEQQPSLSYTFNEHLEQVEHDQFKLTFSMMKYIDINSHTMSSKNHMIENAHCSLLRIGSKIELELSDGTLYIFTITNIKPIIFKNNVQFDYICQDEISFGWSRRNLGMSYSTIERGGVRNIYQITTEVLQSAGIVGWRALPRETNELQTDSLTTQLITLEVKNSNPYNIIIEACNALNAYMSIDWRKKTIYFEQKDKIQFSGYRYYPRTNLQSLEVGASSDNSVTLMHVTGGKDEYDQNISLMPILPQVLHTFWFEYHEAYQTQGIDWNKIIQNDSDYKNMLYYTHYHYNADVEWTSSGHNVNNGDWCGIWIPPEYYQEGNMYSLSLFLSNNEIIDIEMEPMELPNGVIIPFAEISQYEDCIIKDIVDIHKISTRGKIYTIHNENEVWRPIYEFGQIAAVNKSLGNFIYDFSYFVQSGLLKDVQEKELLDMLEIRMAYNNMWLKCLEPIYWRNYSNLYLCVNEAKTTLELLQAARLQDNATDTSYYAGQYQNKILEIQTWLLTLYNNSACISGAIEDPFRFDLINNAMFNEQSDVLIQLKREYDMYVVQMQQSQEYIANNPESSAEENNPYIQQNIDAERTYHLDRIAKLTPVIGKLDGSVHTNCWIYTFEDGTKYPYLATYPRLIMDIYNIMYSAEIEANQPKSIGEQIFNYKANNKMLWTNLYNKYGDFIYEGTYEDDKELNSVSLYNAAVADFQDRKKPNLDVSLSILDLSVLEAVGETNLRVNSKIKIYNKDLNFGENDAQNILSYTNNELVVNTLNYDLRKPGQISISVEQLVPYKYILQKLIQNVN